MKISPSQQPFNKSLFIGIVTSALLHATVLYTFIISPRDDKKSVKQESFTVPLSVFAQKSVDNKGKDTPKETITSANNLEQKVEKKPEKPTLKKLHVKTEPEKKPLLEASNQNPSQPNRDVVSETHAEDDQVKLDSKSVQNPSTFDSKSQSDPVVLNAQNSDQRELFNKIQKEITKKIVYPDAARTMKYEGITRFKFELLKDGTLKHLRITKSSEYSSLDDAVLVAVKKASKHFPEIAKDYTIVMEIDFKITH